MAGVAAASEPSELFDLGNALFERGENEAAIIAFRACLAAAPDHAAAWYDLANALLKAGRPVEAVECFVASLRLRPAFGAAYVNLADALRRLGLLDPARTMAELGVLHLPDQPEAKICLASVLHDRSDYEAAATLYSQVVVGAPDHAGALSSLGNTLHAMGQLSAALAVHDRAVAAAPDDADFHFNRATARLAAGDFARGWEEYEWRWRRAQCPSRDLGDAWQGEELGGRTILLHAEQGLGDVLQFVRYVPMVVERGGRVILEVQRPLLRLLRASLCLPQVLARGDALPSFDVHCPLLSLPRAFVTRLETIPSQLPYLHAAPAAAIAWQAKLPIGGGLRVGLVWAGSPHTDDAGAHLIDRRRSIDLTEFAPFAELADVQLISLQMHDRTQPVRLLPPGLTLCDPMAAVTDFADTAALIANLDLVISVDTSVAHLAGALGRPVWLLSRYDGCWRWLQDRDDSPWYPGLRIYRQPTPGDWRSVLARVIADLRRLAES
jgi:tetratricopeptide (TPR) repeat protein